MNRPGPSGDGELPGALGRSAIPRLLYPVLGLLFLVTAGCTVVVLLTVGTGAASVPLAALTAGAVCLLALARNLRDPARRQAADEA